MPVLRGTMKARRHMENAGGALYYELHPDTFREIPVTMVPYYAWDNRSDEADKASEADGVEGAEDDEMRVWFPLLWD